MLPPPSGMWAPTGVPPSPPARCGMRADGCARHAQHRALRDTQPSSSSGRADKGTHSSRGKRSGSRSWGWEVRPQAGAAMGVPPPHPSFRAGPAPWARAWGTRPPPGLSPSPCWWRSALRRSGGQTDSGRLPPSARRSRGLSPPPHRPRDPPLTFPRPPSHARDDTRCARKAGRRGGAGPRLTRPPEGGHERGGRSSWVPRSHGGGAGPGWWCWGGGGGRARVSARGGARRGARVRPRPARWGRGMGGWVGIGDRGGGGAEGASCGACGEPFPGRRGWVRGTVLSQPPGTRRARVRLAAASERCRLGAPVARRGRRRAARGCSLKRRRGRRRSAKPGGCSSSAAEEAARWVSPRSSSPRPGRPAGMGRTVTMGRSPARSWPRGALPPLSSLGRLLGPRDPLTRRASNGGAGGGGRGSGTRLRLLCAFPAAGNERAPGQLWGLGLAPLL